MNISPFDKEVKPLLKGYSFEYSSFPNEGFGDLERMGLGGLNKLATVELWSKGWISVDMYDCACDEQVMSILLSPEEKNLVPRLIEEFLNKMKVDN